MFHNQDRHPLQKAIRNKEQNKKQETTPFQKFEFFIPLMGIVCVLYGCCMGVVWYFMYVFFMYVHVLCHWCVLRKAHQTYNIM